MKLYKAFFKRAIDIAASCGALLVLAVPLAFVTAWLHFANKGAGAFFRQERPGKGGKIFMIVKFKTMTDERDHEGNLLPDEVRLTKVGHFIRSTSIDELPQLWNVLRGDMSLIGPRPLTTDYLYVFNEFQHRRHEVRPGITGLAQVNGRGFCPLSKKFKYDIEYVDNLSFMLDCRIIYRTILTVLKRKDIGEGEAQMDIIDDLGLGEKIREYNRAHRKNNG